MVQLIIIQDTTLRNYLEAFHNKFSALQWKFFFSESGRFEPSSPC